MQLSRGLQGLTAGFVMLATGSANAVDVTLDYIFTAPSLGLEGDITATFDKDAGATNLSTLVINDLKLNGLTFNLDNPLTFHHFFGPGLDTLEFNNTVLGQNGIYLAVTNASNPALAEFFSAQITTQGSSDSPFTQVGTLAVTAPTSVPEPGTLALLGFGAAAAAATKRGGFMQAVRNLGTAVKTGLNNMFGGPTLEAA